MSKAKTQQALSDIERMSDQAGKLLEAENWLELSILFDNIERTARRGFHIAYELQHGPRSEG